MPDAHLSGKAAWREIILDSRKRIDPVSRAFRDSQIAHHLTVTIKRYSATTVAAYVAQQDEPGGRELLRALVDAGLEVLLPRTPEGPPAPLNWDYYRGALVPGRFGLLEPAADFDRPQHQHLRATHSDARITDADIILVPALAIDRDGYRLGRGAGYYDRTLTGTETVLIGVVDDEEVVPELPRLPTDIPVQSILTPSGVIDISSVHFAGDDAERKLG